ncbi:TadG family pilus assembly protein [Sphingomonas oryzagri]|uniref:TadG family pilus assembly protein n=1 Tax=Sphingomonas oryzagri TaxID=3042314 RepID=A0ABT6MZJ0_9SPHN|nr:TadG family pilus assembly protein [Sphingomonas oryzagri]MDH7638407.1 TadG family pilus assembly protein [Sphingomonas oryzagri]
MIRWLQRLRRDRRGAVTIIAAGSLIALLAATALAVDMGSVYLNSRRLQGVADAAALAAAGAKDPTGAARQAIAINGLAAAQVAALTQGSYTADASLAPGQRYAAGAFPTNAAQVTLEQDVPLFFARAFTGHATTHIAAKATAVRIDYAAFSIGSRLASVQGGLPNTLLSALAGTSLNLSVMDYNALVGTDIDVLKFSDALRTQLKLTGATFGQTLDTNVTLPQALSALAAVTPDSTAAAALNRIALKVSPVTVRLSDLIDLGPYANQDHADPDTVVKVDGYSVLRELLQLSNGQRQVALNLGLSLPGVTSTTLTLAIGQRPSHSPWLAITQAGGTFVRTAQARLYLDTRVGGVATLGIASLRVPILIELAEAQAKLDSISCSGGAASASVTLDAQPAVGSIAIADIDTATLGDFTVAPTENRALLAHALLLDVTAKAHAALGGVTWQPVTFSAADIKAGSIRPVSTGDILQGVATSLMKSMDLQVKVLGLGVNASAATQLVGGVLMPLSPALDGIVDQVTGLLGVHVGQADLRVDGVRCGKPTLVA